MGQPYWLRKRLLQLVIGLPTPLAVTRALRFFVHTRLGEGFGDMHINGERRFIDEHVPLCHTLVDVGAGAGDWTALALHANPQVQVHCFEPLSAPFARLQARGFPASVVCHQLALSDGIDEAEMGADTQSLHERHPPARARERVRRMTLDAHAAAPGIDRIDMLKIDAEGHDLAVLRGARGLIEAGRVSRIQFEYGPANIWSRVLLRDFFAFFDGLPFAIHQITPHGLRPRAYDTRMENFIYKNFVALQRSITIAGVPPSGGRTSA